jgi:nucleoside-diphosphate-sugar epimerase
VLLTGATSQLGVFLIPRLLRERYRVLAVSRKAAAGNKPDANPDANPVWLQPGDLTYPGRGESSRFSADTIEFLVSCGPLELTISAVSSCARLRRIVLFSTSSVYVKTASRDSAEREQMAGILQRENILKVLCDRAKIDLVILRPTMIYGCGLDQNISRLARWIRRFGWLPVAGQASGLRQPVHADDLAALAVEALRAPGRLALDSPACGGDTLSYREMVERIFDGLSRPRRLLSLPPGVLSLALGLSARIGLGKNVNREMVARQNVDLVFDDRAIRQALGYQPRPFRPGPADYEVPAEAARHQPGWSPSSAAGTSSGAAAPPRRPGGA